MESENTPNTPNTPNDPNDPGTDVRGLPLPPGHLNLVKDENCPVCDWLEMSITADFTDPQNVTPTVAGCRKCGFWVDPHKGTQQEAMLGQLRALKTLGEHGAPGPWTVESDFDGDEHSVVSEDDEPGIAYVAQRFVQTLDEGRADAHFTAHSKEFAPRAARAVLETVDTIITYQQMIDDGAVEPNEGLERVLESLRRDILIAMIDTEEDR